MCPAARLRASCFGSEATQWPQPRAPPAADSKTRLPVARRGRTLPATGPATVRWQAAFSLSEQQAGVSLSPQQGELAAGATVSLQIQNTTRASGRQGTSGRNGV